MEKSGSIYKITNEINGKVYIGQTNGNGWNRWRSHISMLRRGVHTNSYLQNAFDKHGENSFVFTVHGRYPLSKLDVIEISMISKHKTLKNCYNIEDGGKLVKKMDDSTREKLSKTLIEKFRTDKDFRERHFLLRAKKIICLNNNEVYDSIRDASQKLNVDYQGIWQVLIGNNSYAMCRVGTPYQFSYYEEGKRYEAKKIELNPTTIKRKIICVNTKEVFNDVEMASKKYKIHKNSILRCCRRERRFSGRLKNGDWIAWRYLDEYDENEEISFNRKGKNSHRSKPVICLTTGEVFDSAAEACNKYNISSGSLSQALKGKRNHCGTLQDGNKLRWTYA